jgi:4'-phosphopantetheinyl transferase
VAIAPVHLWQVELDVGAEAEAELRAELTADEIARAEEFASPAARRRFVVARGTLRVLLGDLLGESPRSIALEEGPSGKPRLAGAGQRLGFNVSHSGGLALICIADGFEVGVDLEHLRPVPDAVEIARRRFAPEEARFVEKGGAAEVDRRFLTCWTRKEALTKALGAGLSFDLRSFAVPLDEPRGIVSLAAPGGERAQRWSILDVPLGEEHVAALALPYGSVELIEASGVEVDGGCQ